jgi:hypothetical protein
MAYGIESPRFLDGSAVSAERARFARSVRTDRAWRELSAQSRLELIEKALEKPANDDMPDGLPVAL